MKLDSSRVAVVCAVLSVFCAESAASQENYLVGSNRVNLAGAIVEGGCWFDAAQSQTKIDLGSYPSSYFDANSDTPRKSAAVVIRCSSPTEASIAKLRFTSSEVSADRPDALKSGVYGILIPVAFASNAVDFTGANLLSLPESQDSSYKVEAWMTKDENTQAVGSGSINVVFTIHLEYQ